MAHFNPKTEALAFRIWAHCEPIGWNIDVKSVAVALDENWHRVRSVAQHKKWLNRFRVRPDKYGYWNATSTPREINFDGGVMTW